MNNETPAGLKLGRVSAFGEQLTPEGWYYYRNTITPGLCGASRSVTMKYQCTMHRKMRQAETSPQFSGSSLQLKNNDQGQLIIINE
jgi:hypothetical protein